MWLVHMTQGLGRLWSRAYGCAKSWRICDSMLCWNQGMYIKLYMYQGNLNFKWISLLFSKVSVEVQKGQEFFEREYPCLAAVNRCASTVCQQILFNFLFPLLTRQWLMKSQGAPPRRPCYMAHLQARGHRQENCVFGETTGIYVDTWK